MNNPTIELGVELMDHDHLRIERMLESAAQAPDAELPRLHQAIAAELAAHFAREETLMRERRVPGLFCHISQHSVVLAELKRHGEAVDGAALRRSLAVAVPQLILSHIATMDRMAVAYINGDIAQSDFDALRLPVPGATGV